MSVLDCPIFSLAIIHSLTVFYFRIHDYIFCNQLLFYVITLLDQYFILRPEKITETGMME